MEAFEVRVLRVEFEAEPRTIEDVLREVMAEARRRAHMSTSAFAAAINESSPRNPGLLAETIEAYEAGVIAPPGDILCRAMEQGGHDVVAALGAWLTGPRRFPLQTSVGARGASGPR